jgi:putative MATE family efflux protein
MASRAKDLVSGAHSTWRIFVLAMQGKQHDYTTESLGRAVLLLAIPMVLEMVAESIFTIVNIFWVSRLSSEAVAAVGLTEAAMSLIYAFAVGISFAATAFVARRIGENDDTGSAAQTAGQVILLSIVVSVGLGMLLCVFAAEILRLLGADEAVVALGAEYTRVMFAGNVTVFLMYVINAILRGTGDAALAMRALWYANVLNFVLVPCLLYGWGPFPELGVTGAAYATTICRGVGVIFLLWHMTGDNSHVRLRLRLHHLKPVVADIRMIMTTAWSGIAQILVSTTSAIGLFSIAALSGTTALAGCTVALRVVQFVLMPALGLANAGATLVGQNLGAGNPERATEAVRIATRYNVIFLGSVGAVLFILARPIAGIFTSDPEVLREAVLALRMTTVAFPFFSAGMCYQAAFNGAGDTWTPARLNFICFWLLQVPLAWVLAVGLGFDSIGVYASVPISFSVLALGSALLFSRGKWKIHRI